MDVLIDSNIILDVIQNREPFTTQSKEILQLCIEKKLHGFMSSHSLCDIFYILRKDLSLKERLSLIEKLCEYMSVIPELQDDFKSISRNPDTKDLEDSLQMKCAVNFHLDYIITRNVKDFSNTKIPAIDPKSFLIQIIF